MAKDEKFIPLSVPHLSGNEKKYVNQCLDENWISSVGSFIPKFENSFAEYVGAKHAVAVMNGTCALHLALILSGVSAGEEVFVPSLTFIAPVNAIRYVGAQPVFIDVDPATLGISPSALETFINNRCDFDGQRLFNKKTGHIISAIIPVHLYGHVCNMEAINQIASKYQLKVIEDAAEAVGAFFNGVHAGRFGNIGCFSFNGNKILTTGGGGMIVSDDAEIAKMARHLSTQAKTDEFFYYHDRIGYNYRMLNIQAAIGFGQLEHLEEMIARKRELAQKYIAKFANVDGISFFTEPKGCRSTYWFFLIFLKAGKDLKPFCKHMTDNRIQVRPFWGLNHMHQMFKDFDHDDLSGSIKLYETGICLPCNQGMSDDDLERVVSAVKDFIHG